MNILQGFLKLNVAEILQCLLLEFTTVKGFLNFRKLFIYSTVIFQRHLIINLREPYNMFIIYIFILDHSPVKVYCLGG